MAVDPKPDSGNYYYLRTLAKERVQGFAFVLWSVEKTLCKRLKSNSASIFKFN